jgi:hypothetical protein
VVVDGDNVVVVVDVGTERGQSDDGVHAAVTERAPELSPNVSSLSPKKR